MHGWECLHVFNSSHHKESDRKAGCCKSDTKLLKSPRKQRLISTKACLNGKIVTSETIYNRSPLQKLMSRKARLFLPCTEEKRIPNTVSRVHEDIRERQLENAKVLS